MAVPSAITQATERPQIERAVTDSDPTPAPASAGLLVLAALLLGGGGVAVGPPGLAGRLLAHVRERLGGGHEADGAEQPAVAGSIPAAPRLVPLTVVEDAHERGGRILPPT